MRRAAFSSTPGDLQAQIAIGSCALFFDADGTLLELRARPGDVRADADLIDLLGRLRDATQGALALVSGRSLTDLDRIFAPLRLPAAALHGAAVRYPGGAVRSVDARIMDSARPAAAAFVRAHPGLLLEDKGATLAIHFRERPELASAVLGFMSSFSPSDEIGVQEGKMVCEWKPAVFDKGNAIASISRHAPFLGRRPVFFGDDLTDEAGFAAVNAQAGLSVRVGAPGASTKAMLSLPDPAALRRLLKDLVRFGQEAL